MIHFDPSGSVPFVAAFASMVKQPMVILGNVMIAVVVVMVVMMRFFENGR